MDSCRSSVDRVSVHGLEDQRFESPKFRYRFSSSGVLPAEYLFEKKSFGRRISSSMKFFYLLFKLLLYGFAPIHTLVWEMKLSSIFDNGKMSAVLKGQNDRQF